MVWSAFAENQHPRRYNAGQLIYLQGTYPNYFYYIVSGSARSFISTQSGDERVLTIHRAGDLMGEASFFDECPRVTSAMAIEDCLIVSVDRSTLDHILKTRPELVMPMMRHLARTVRLLSVQVNNAALPARQRIARYLLSRADGDPGRAISCTHEEIGQAVGVSRVTVSRVLGEWAKLGVLRLGYGTISVLDFQELERME